MSLTLLQTKLYIPPPRLHLVRRDHLLTRLRDEAMRPLTLIAAPAGFGKTTLVSEWIHRNAEWGMRSAELSELPHSALRIPHAAFSTPHSVAWLALDADDNDPVRFFTYLIAALQTQQPALGVSAQELLAAPQTPPLKAILTLLLNDLSSIATPLTLVLDDYHLIATAAIHEALAFWVDHLPPSLHLIMTSRIDPPLPLARWRVRQQMVEIRADDLRFRPEEAATFLNDVMDLRLSVADIALLETRTEGWIAGLQLAALSMQGRADRSSFIQTFSGSNRHVLSYLVEEVLNQHPASTLDFLLQSSILEQLSAPLCDAVTGRSDSQQILQQLEQANLFLIPLDDAGQWYRYHHLFADVLRSRLQQTQPQLAVQLYQRASLWCEQHDRLPEAVQHALACQDTTRAAGLIEQWKITFFPDPSLQGALHQWIALLPDEVLRRHPRLCVIHAWLLYSRTEIENALAQVEAAEVALAQHPYANPEQTRTVRHEMLATRALFMAYAPQPDFAQVVALGEEVLTHATPERAGVRSMAAGAIATAYLKQSDLPRGIFFLDQALQIVRSSQDIYLIIASAVNLALAQRAAGLLRAAITTCQQMVDWLRTQGKTTYPALGALYTTLADLLREVNDLPSAAHYASEGVILCDRWAHPYHALISRFVLLRIKQAQGDWAGVWAMWQEVASQAEQAYFLPVSFLAAAKNQLLLWQGEATEAVAWWHNTSWVEAIPATILSGQEFVYNYEYDRTMPAQVALAHARATDNQTILLALLDHLARQQQAATREGLLWLRIKVYCLQALTYAALHQKEQALAALDQAITLAEPEGYIRLFVDEGEALRFLIFDFRSSQDKLWGTPRANTPQNTKSAVYVDKILAGFGDNLSLEDKTLVPEPPKIVNPKSKIQNLIEPLSDREWEVLQLVVDGLSNGEIAAKLIVSKGTVKTHINHIFGKLGVQNRSQAVARGRELGLFSA